MGSTDLQQLERRARQSYERARVVRALVGGVPLAVLAVLAALLSRRPGSITVLGPLLFLVGVALLWRGRDAGRGLLPGALAGVIPLTMSLVANLWHGCASGHCSSWCVPACTAGGVIAGALVSVIALRRNLGLGFWAGASTISLLTGAMGCSCVGYSGLVALAAGFAGGVLPQLLRRRFATR